MVIIDKSIELLAPSGDMESLYAAVNNGADAIYMGGSKFSARAFAKNFSLEDLQEAVDYCHSYGVKVYITINTLIKQKELKEVLEYINELYNIGVDAIITQDLGLANVVMSLFGDLEIHASTQMTIHNKEASLFLKAMGFHRVVLARELSLNEIAEISKEVETEIFVHGALCVCYSGQCLMSSMIGGRSGNRGRCAQPCRLPYDIIDKQNGMMKHGYILSPKDMCTSAYIDQIIDSGVSSLKIEGRMKRPEYVAGVVQSYRKQVDAHLDGIKITDGEQERKKLLQLFNREGFSKAYLFGNEGRDMMAYSNPKNTGVAVGRAIEGNVVELFDALCINDGIRVGDEGTLITNINKNGIDIEAAYGGEKVKITPQIYKKGDTIYKTTDNKLNEILKGTYTNKYNKKFKVEINVEFLPGLPIKLKCSYKGKNYEQVGTVVETPINKPLTKGFIEEKLKKSGNTPFEIINVNFEAFNGGYLSAASINEVRRNLLSQLAISGSKREFKKIDFDGINFSRALDKSEYKGANIPDNLFTVNSNEQLKALEDLGVKAAAVDIYSRYIDKDEALKSNIPDIYLKLPNISRKEFWSIVKFVDTNLHKIKGIITANLGFIEYFSKKTQCIADYKLNIFNSESLGFVNEYCDAAALSIELNKMEIKEIMSNFPKAYGAQILVYGKAELMVSEYCSVGSVLGGKSKDNSCKAQCKGDYTLKDRKGAEFVIRNDDFCRSHIYNSVPINLIEEKGEMKKLGINYFRYDFIDESYEDTYRVADAVMNNRTLELEQFTRGHYKRGVD